MHIHGVKSNISGLEYCKKEIFLGPNKTEIKLMTFFGIKYY